MSVRGNTLEVQGGYPAVDIVGQEIPWRGECVFSDNRCRLEAPKPRLVIKVAAGALIFSNNNVQGLQREKGIAIVELTVGQGKGPYTVLGNISEGEIEVNGDVLEDPWRPLNVIW